MTHFFISYAKRDTRDLAIKLSDLLNTLSGVTAWVDRSLKAGKAWELQIQSEIDRCDCMIVLYSPDINRHKSGEEESYMLTEIAYAKYTAKKPIIPVMVQPTQPPISLTMLQYIDFTLPGLTLDDPVTAICEEANITPPVSQKTNAPQIDKTDKNASRNNSSSNPGQTPVSSPVFLLPGKSVNRAAKFTIFCQPRLSGSTSRQEKSPLSKEGAYQKIDKLLMYLPLK